MTAITTGPIQVGFRHNAAKVLHGDVNTPANNGKGLAVVNTERINYSSLDPSNALEKVLGIFITERGRCADKAGHRRPSLRINITVLPSILPYRRCSTSKRNRLSYRS